ncbi:tetraacyldisaccharide 4'-kinase [Paraglaciecola chathamensis]|uniref:Tetraacyldisaccharide 4'-kinase n=1 Tax=Paraglaciecola chathamensis TaxID=368405 RepID=A0ABS0WED6_9ALTE|nr:tetraacyldisaccharide 4'-kinase [Paraglaciecola chathamensis]
MRWVERIWYQRPWFKWPGVILLLPLTFLFWALSTLRRLAFSLGLKASVKLSAPVIIVGNISVGGNGKTPLVVHLADFLQANGYRPGVLSRGYGGNSAEYPCSVTPASLPTEVGDEPVLMRQRIQCPMVVDPVRARGAQHLITEHQCDVIICDDGLQHYALKRDIEIVVMDGTRRTGNHFLLPSGPLRESEARLKTVDFVVVNGEQGKKGEYVMTLAPGDLVNLKNPKRRLALNELDSPIVAAAGIGHPERFFRLLKQHKVVINNRLSFTDHHAFQASDLPKERVLMTEKDAVKCQEFAHDDWWYLPVDANIDNVFEQQLLTKLRNVK